MHDYEDDVKAVDGQLVANPLIDGEAFPWSKGLTYKQALYVGAYAGDNKPAAVAAGVAPSTGTKWLKNSTVVKAIHVRAAFDVNPHLIATRNDLLMFWTGVMRDRTKGMGDRIRVSELLGRAKCMFSDKVVHEGEVTHRQALTQSLTDSVKAMLDVKALDEESKAEDTLSDLTGALAQLEDDSGGTAASAVSDNDFDDFLNG